MTEDRAISLNAAIKCVESHEYTLKAAAELRELPSVTPQRPKGHWITTRTFMHDGEFYCDKCKCDAPNNEKWDYCPNCGADMRGDDDEQATD